MKEDGTALSGGLMRFLNMIVDSVFLLLYRDFQYILAYREPDSKLWSHLKILKPPGQVCMGRLQNEYVSNYKISHVDGLYRAEY